MLEAPDDRVLGEFLDGVKRGFSDGMVHAIGRRGAGGLAAALSLAAAQHDADRDLAAGAGDVHDGDPHAAVTVEAARFRSGCRGEIGYRFDHLDLAGVDPETEALAQQPSDGGGDLDLVDIGREIQPQQPGTAGVVVADIGGADAGNAAQREQDFVDADGSAGGHEFLVGVVTTRS